MLEMRSLGRQVNSEVGIGHKEANGERGKPGLTDKLGDENSDRRGRAHEFLAQCCKGM